MSRDIFIKNSSLYGWSQITAIGNSGVPPSGLLFSRGHLVPNVSLGTQCCEAPLHHNTKANKCSVWRSQTEFGNERRNQMSTRKKILVISFPTSRHEVIPLRLGKHFLGTRLHYNSKVKEWSGNAFKLSLGMARTPIFTITWKSHRTDIITEVVFRERAHGNSCR